MRTVELLLCSSKRSAARATCWNNPTFSRSSIGSRVGWIFEIKYTVEVYSSINKNARYSRNPGSCSEDPDSTKYDPPTIALRFDSISTSGRYLKVWPHTVGRTKQFGCEKDAWLTKNSLLFIYYHGGYSYELLRKPPLFSPAAINIFPFVNMDAVSWGCGWGWSRATATGFHLG